MPASNTNILLVFSTLVLSTSANTFLKLEQGDHEISKGFNIREEAENLLMKELAATFRPGAKKDHIIALEAQLKPMFKALPKMADDTIPQEVVRYVLHRFFLQRGWFIQGLQPLATKPTSVANNTNTNNTLGAVQQWAPTYLYEFLEQLHGGRSISVRELAVFAATLEDLAHKEALYGFDKVLVALELDKESRPSGFGSVHEASVKMAMQGYMMSYHYNYKPSQLSQAFVRSEKKNLKDFHNVDQWTQNITSEVGLHYTGDQWTVDQQSLGQAVETIGERYGSFHNKQCSNLKSELLHFESAKSGRIRLSDLYVKGFTVQTMFNDRIEYLRDLGVLDESDPKDPLVIVPNYIHSRPNCKTVSSFHSICCRNECEDLVGKLEHQIGEAHATPARILELVAQLSSDTVPAPRMLSSNLTNYLHMIVENNDGYGHGNQVPLHGRLFAQWMHHAFPRECPFPNLAQSTTAETPEEWGIKNGVSSQMSREEILNSVDAETVDCLHEEIVNKQLLKNGRKGQVSAACLKQPHTDTELPWTNVEELLIRGSPHMQARQSPGVMRRVFVFVALGSMAWAAKSLVGGTDVSWLDDSHSKMV